jgi:hypothetical protein
VVEWEFRELILAVGMVEELDIIQLDLQPIALGEEEVPRTYGLMVRP